MAPAYKLLTTPSWSCGRQRSSYMYTQTVVVDPLFHAVDRHLAATRNRKQHATSAAAADWLAGSCCRGSGGTDRLGWGWLEGDGLCVCVCVCSAPAASTSSQPCNDSLTGAALCRRWRWTGHRHSIVPARPSLLDVATVRPRRPDRSAYGINPGSRNRNNSSTTAGILWSATAAKKHTWMWNYHRLRGSASPVLTATGFVNGKVQFSTPPHRIDTPQPITKKFVTGDYVGDPYGCAKLGAYPSKGGFWAHGWNITKINFVYTPFLGTHLQVRHRDGFSRMMAQTTRTRARMCLFVNFSHCSQFRGSKTPKTLNFGAWIGVFKPNSRNRKTSIFSKLLHRFQPNFA